MSSRLLWMALAIVTPAFAVRLQVERNVSAANLSQSAVGVKQTHKHAIGDLCEQIHQPSHAEYNLWRPTATSYSQIGQDSRLAKILTNSGFFLESGAADGELNSNSLYYEKLGWTGLLVEPHPGTFKTLLGKNRKAFTFNGGLSTTGDVGQMELTFKDCAGYVGDGECSHMTRNLVPVQVAPVDQLLLVLGALLWIFGR